MNYKLYDEIISATYVNITNSILEKGENGVFSVGKDVVFSEFPKNDDYAMKVFQRVGFMVAGHQGVKVAIEMSLPQFLYQKYFKKNSLLRRKKKNENVTIDVETLAPFEAGAFCVDMNIYKEIWEAYYKKG